MMRNREGFAYLVGDVAQLVNLFRIKPLVRLVTSVGFVFMSLADDDCTGYCHPTLRRHQSIHHCSITVSALFLQQQHKQQQEYVTISIPYCTSILILDDHLFIHTKLHCPTIPQRPQPFFLFFPFLFNNYYQQSLIK